MPGEHQEKIQSWSNETGAFKRLPSQFRNKIAKGGEFEPEKGRYWLYVCLACPWAHRTLIVRKLKGLEDIINVSVVHPHMGEKGWSFSTNKNYDGQGTAHLGANKEEGIEALAKTYDSKDPLYGYEFIRQFYFEVNPQYDGRFTVPMLWDSKTKAIVNNESSEIIRNLNDAFDDIIDPKYKGVTFCPSDLEKQIDELNERTYNSYNNGVYRSGFATAQASYEEAVKEVFGTLDYLEKLLSDGRKYLLGDRLTESDVRVYTTSIRFDPVYHGHFKTNFNTIRHGYPNVNKWMKNLYWNHPEFKETTNFEHIKIHYYTSHSNINPTRVVPAGPVPDIESLE